MAVVPFPARNKLAYPSGTRAGIDPSHPASTGLVLSCVAGPGNNYVNLLTGAPLIAQNAQSTAPTASIHGIIGPAVTTLTGGKALGVAIDPARVFTRLTAAGIFRYSSSTATGYQTVIAINGKIGLFIQTDRTDFYQGGDNFGVTLAFDTPYFVAVSSRIDGASSPFSIVVKNLITGQIFTTTGTATTSMPSPVSAINVGNDTSNEFSNFPLAAAVFSDNYLSLPQLLQWSADPWAFWYPPQIRSRVAAAAAATFLAGWAQQTNLPVLGTGTY